MVADLAEMLIWMCPQRDFSDKRRQIYLILDARGAQHFCRVEASGHILSCIPRYVEAADLIGLG